MNISFFGASIRPERWKHFDDQLSKTNLDFEIIWVGPKGLKGKLPKHTKWIKTNVKPMQCWEIGARATQSEVICVMVDDINVGPYMYDKVYEIYKKANNYKTLIQPRYHRYNGKGRKISDRTWTLAFPCRHKKVPKKDYIQTVDACSVYSRKFFFELGGYDKNFIAAHGGQDISLRAIEAGANIIICEETFPRHVDDICIVDMGLTGLIKKTHDYDYNYLFSLYIRKNRRVNRTKKFEPFINKNILKTSQGPKGVWE